MNKDDFKKHEDEKKIKPKKKKKKIKIHFIIIFIAIILFSISMSYELKAQSAQMVLNEEVLKGAMSKNEYSSLLPPEIQKIYGIMNMENQIKLMVIISLILLFLGLILWLINRRNKDE